SGGRGGGSGEAAVSAPVAERERLAALAAAKGAELEGAHPVEVLRWAAAEFGDRFCIASSMGDGLLASLAAQAPPGIDVGFLDTGTPSAEPTAPGAAGPPTLRVNLLPTPPRQPVAEQAAESGPQLHAGAPDRCCALRKVEPLARALAPYHAWASGIRRDETANR